MRWEMPSREEKIARNEAATREINEDIEEAHQEASRPGYVRVLCECGRDECDRVLALTTEEYERVRDDPRQFAVAHDHVMPDVERVVTETDRYVVVAKREGTPAGIAREEAPRS